MWVGKWVASRSQGLTAQLDPITTTAKWPVSLWCVWELGVGGRSENLQPACLHDGRPSAAGACDLLFHSQPQTLLVTECSHAGGGWGQRQPQRG